MWNAFFFCYFTQQHGGCFNITMSSYQYRKSHFRYKTILRPFYLHNWIFYTGKMTSLYWIMAMMFVRKVYEFGWDCSIIVDIHVHNDMLFAKHKRIIWLDRCRLVQKCHMIYKKVANIAWAMSSRLFHTKACHLDHYPQAITDVCKI